MKISNVLSIGNIVQLGFLGVLFPFVIGIVYTAAQTDNFYLQYTDLLWILICCGFATVFVLTELKIKIHLFVFQLSLFAILGKCSIELEVAGISWILALTISAICISIISLHNINRSL